jgi:hypothetical protein
MLDRSLQFVVSTFLFCFGHHGKSRKFQVVYALQPNMVAVLGLRNGLVKSLGSYSGTSPPRNFTGRTIVVIEGII